MGSHHLCGSIVLSSEPFLTGKLICSYSRGVKPRSDTSPFCDSGTGSNAGGMLLNALVHGQNTSARVCFGKRDKAEFEQRRKELSGVPFLQSSVNSPSCFGFKTSAVASSEAAGSVHVAFESSLNELTGTGPEARVTRIIAIGIGTAGGKMVGYVGDHLAWPDAEFWAMNTDVQALKASRVPRQLQLGADLMRGLGTGGDSAAGAKAAAASAAAIAQVVGGQPGVCYVICGAGGGTGGGASPLVLRAARAAGHLAVAVVTLPFSFEGPRRVRQSRATVAALQEAADLVFGIEQDSFLQHNQHLSMTQAAGMAADMALHTTRGIAQLLQAEPSHFTAYPGASPSPLTPAHLIKMLQASGRAAVGHGEGATVQQAMEAAVHAPGLGSLHMFAAHILCVLSSPLPLGSDQLQAALARVREGTGGRAQLLVATRRDTRPPARGAVAATIILTGLPREQSPAAGPSPRASRPSPPGPRPPRTRPHMPPPAAPREAQKPAIHKPPARQEAAKPNNGAKDAAGKATDSEGSSPSIVIKDVPLQKVERARSLGRSDQAASADGRKPAGASGRRSANLAAAREGGAQEEEARSPGGMMEGDARVRPARGRRAVSMPSGGERESQTAGGGPPLRPEKLETAANADEAGAGGRPQQSEAGGRRKEGQGGQVSLERSSESGWDSGSPGSSASSDQTFASRHLRARAERGSQAGAAGEGAREQGGPRLSGSSKGERAAGAGERDPGDRPAPGMASQGRVRDAAVAETDPKRSLEPPVEPRGARSLPEGGNFQANETTSSDSGGELDQSYAGPSWEDVEAKMHRAAVANAAALQWWKEVVEAAAESSDEGAGESDDEEANDAAEARAAPQRGAVSISARARTILERERSQERYRLVRVKQVLPDGSLYEGQIATAGPHGLGTCVSPSGDVYEGGWRRGVRHGWGRLREKTGDVYEGSWRRGHRHGQGRVVYANGHVLTARFVDGHVHGPAIIAFSHGTTFYGAFRFSRRQGVAMSVDADGQREWEVWDHGRRLS